MAAYADKAAKALMPEPFERIEEWRKSFFKPFTDEQIAELEALSDRVDELWATHTQGKITKNVSISVSECDSAVISDEKRY